jgi:hypothetical protein
MGALKKAYDARNLLQGTNRYEENLQRAVEWERDATKWGLI